MPSKTLCKIPMYTRLAERPVKAETVLNKDSGLGVEHGKQSWSTHSRSHTHTHTEHRHTTTADGDWVQRERGDLSLITGGLATGSKRCRHRPKRLSPRRMTSVSLISSAFLIDLKSFHGVGEEASFMERVPIAATLILSQLITQ